MKIDHSFVIPLDFCRLNNDVFRYSLSTDVALSNGSTVTCEMSSTGTETQWTLMSDTTSKPTFNTTDFSLVMVNDTRVPLNGTENTTASASISTSTHKLSTATLLLQTHSLLDSSTSSVAPQTKSTNTVTSVSQEDDRSQTSYSPLYPNSIQEQNLQIILPTVIPATLVILSLILFVGFYCFNQRVKKSKRKSNSEELGSASDSSSHTYSLPDDNIYEMMSTAEMDDFCLGYDVASPADNHDNGDSNIIYVDNPTTVYCTKL